jgi:endoglucanase
MEEREVGGVAQRESKAFGKWVRWLAVATATFTVTLLLSWGNPPPNTTVVSSGTETVGSPSKIGEFFDVSEASAKNKNKKNKNKKNKKSQKPKPAPIANPVPTEPGPGVTPTPDPGPTHATFGINLAGGEFGSNLPGTYNWDYTYPTAQELDYYKGKGRLVVRVPFRWERLQRTLNGPLDPTEMARIDTIMGDARSRGMVVLLDCHNFGRYKVDGTNEQVLGTSQVPNAAFADLWRKIADRYKNESAVYGYGLMNEPHDMGDDKRWPTAAQMTVDEIRKVDTAHTILVAGDHWSGAHSWRNTSNENLDIQDPANRLVYEAHQYFDNDHSGIYDQSYDGEGANPGVGVDRVRPFVEWLRAKGKKGFVGEFGVPGNDPRWNTALDNFLSYLKANNVGGTYWAGGPWWGNYPLSIEPTNNFATDKPQMSVLQKHP